MAKLVIFYILLVLLCLEVVFSCTIRSDLSGNITDDRNVGKEKCWKIIVPADNFLKIEFVELQAPNCEYTYVEIQLSETGEKYRSCGSNLNKTSIVALNDVTVTTFGGYNYFNVKLHLQYSIQSKECANNKSFRCSPHSCVPKYKVCDGVEDCENGADELGCVRAIEGVTESRGSAISWLRRKHSTLLGWGANTARAVVALQLASGANFNGSDTVEELMAKQTELQIAEGLLRSSLSNNELSTALHSLLVTCHNPRRFYGIDLVKRLKTQVEQTTNFTHPIVYLALCNANESWPNKAVEDLTNILTSDSNYQFVNDIQAMAIMAVSCVRNHRDLDRLSQNTTLFEVYQEKIKHFKETQQNDGSFGNVYTTAFITQALISSGHENNIDWKLNSTIRYLMKHLNSSSVDFLSTYLTLPLLNSKTIADISEMDCSKNPRKHGDDPVSDINDYIGPKARVQYSLYIGDNKEAIHTISLLVPKNYTALEVMKLAEAENPKYRFEHKLMSNAYVYKIAGITNDPEVGKFWLLYYAANSYETLTHLTNLEDLKMENGSHFVMWYKTANI